MRERTVGANVMKRGSMADAMAQAMNEAETPIARHALAPDMTGETHRQEAEAP